MVQHLWGITGSACSTFAVGRWLGYDIMKMIWGHYFVDFKKVKGVAAH